MNRLGPEFRVGIFVIIGIVVTLFAVLVINPETFETEEKSLYYTVLKDASGILEKTHVKTNGVNVGKVRQVELVDNATKVWLEVDKAVGIPVGSEIEIRTVGFLGDRFIEIRRTDDLSKGMVADGGMIPRAADSTDLNEVIAIVGSIGKDIKKVTSNLAKVLGDEQGEQRIANIVDNIEDFTAEIKEILQENRADVRSLVTNIQKFSASLDEVLNEDNKQRIDQILANFDDSMVEVRGATRNINLISERIEKGEGTIGRLVNEDDTLVELEGALKDIRKALAPVNQIKVEVDYHNELRTDESSANYFNLKFHTRPGSYYLLGFTDAGFLERRVETIDIPDTTDSETGEVTSEEIIREERREALRFNAQIARRWHWAAVRFGLIESTGGIAGDFYALDDRLRFTLEVFDFADKDDEVRSFAHVKAYASALFYNHIYILAGVDDPTKKDIARTEEDEKGPHYFFGAGVQFNDEDLRALFGLAAVTMAQ